MNKNDQEKFPFLLTFYSIIAALADMILFLLLPNSWFGLIAIFIFPSIVFLVMKKEAPPQPGDQKKCFLILLVSLLFSVAETMLCCSETYAALLMRAVLLCFTTTFGFSVYRRFAVPAGWSIPFLLLYMLQLIAPVGFAISYPK